ncbi:NBR1-Ig-like domain-containing protein [Actinokineospora iranica]|uniref:Ig-like domain-containing protein n=1 Tax=Actinokineospora iranica TaxID=1271860 RepID=A0A1G6U875_9PSEU|nr:NBR1-Ig-like domain-containing protein [Actinokineospora iranica]SDD36896.1 Ig-like domain-containing protein [Actinokineospora iranica]
MRTNLTTAAGRAARAVLRGRPPAPAPVHVLANRELSVAMRQLRMAVGINLGETVAILNETIDDLYADVRDAPTPGGRVPSTPHRVTGDYVRRVERGDHGRFDLGTLPAWARRSEVEKNRLNASRVPAWLVRAYDVAFGADGFLVDMHTWSVALQADQLRDLPRRLRDLPGHVPPGGEYEFLVRDLGELDEQARDLLRAQAGELAALRDRQPGGASWLPFAKDASLNAGEAEEPEGMLVAPGSLVTTHFVLRNAGTVPWRDRLLYRVGDTATGIASPPLVPVPDTEPGADTAEIGYVLRAPTTPGTYRVCVKMGWPDGTYCFPTTLLGLVTTLVVPPADIIDPYREWPDHVG